MGSFYALKKLEIYAWSKDCRFNIVDPSHVIGLYPNLLPQEFRNQLTYPERPPDLEGGELEKALLALQDYLTQVRLRYVDISCFIVFLQHAAYNNHIFGPNHLKL